MRQYDFKQIQQIHRLTISVTFIYLERFIRPDLRCNTFWPNFFRFLSLQSKKVRYHVAFSATKEKCGTLKYIDSLKNNFSELRVFLKECWEQQRGYRKRVLKSQTVNW